jgi:hypothetical protein
MNEWGVAIAESSTTGRIVAPSDKGVYVTNSSLYMFL